VAAAVVIALVFQPLRQRASRLANRLVYGHRATPSGRVSRPCPTRSSWPARI
jgi:hypothetical protein